MPHPSFSLFFFFNDTATTEIYTLSLHDALPISFSPATQLSVASASPLPRRLPNIAITFGTPWRAASGRVTSSSRDRKSTRLNSSHDQISYAVFCLKKKKTTQFIQYLRCSRNRTA